VTSVPPKLCIGHASFFFSGSRMEKDGGGAGFYIPGPLVSVGNTSRD
jgi:hypothetical protein